jgi:hypothetical protein
MVHQSSQAAILMDLKKEKFSLQYDLDQKPDLSLDDRKD